MRIQPQAPKTRTTPLSVAFPWQCIKFGHKPYALWFALTGTATGTIYSHYTPICPNSYAYLQPPDEVPEEKKYKNLAIIALLSLLGHYLL